MQYVALGISIISLVWAIISFLISFNSQKLQNRVNTLELKIKEYELREKENAQIKTPCVEAMIEKITRNNYTIQIINTGNAKASNISVSWEKLDGIIIRDQGKMPYEFLDPMRWFELPLLRVDNAPRKISITTEWETEEGEKHSKVQVCDL